jgi:opacity protein-like surface antigen
MRRWVIFFAALLLFGVSASIASAQEETPKVEVFGGYSYVRGNLGFGFPGFNMNGGSASVAYNPNEWLGLVADFGGYHVGNIGGVPVSGNLYTYLFGPKIAYREGRWTLFGQTLFGGAHASAGGTALVPTAGVRPQALLLLYESGSANAFAMAIGGGLDANITSHFGVRVIQAEYLMTRFGVVHSSDTQNNARISAGVVFRF